MTSNTQIKRISVFEFLNSPYAVSTEEGERLSSEIINHFKKEEKLLLDFENIELIVSTFLNASIGQLYSGYTSEFIKEHLFLENMTNDDLSVLKKVTDRAKEYFKDKGDIRDIFNKYFPDEQ
jgi:STAS-like domain of unknown function (DUF4325)